MINLTIKWDSRDFTDGIQAVHDTLHRPGVGVSYYRSRPALPTDKGKPARAWMILGAIKARTGRNPLDVPAPLEREIAEMLNEEVVQAMETAMATKRLQRERIKRAIIGGARDMREDAQDRIAQNATGFKNAARYAKRKAIMLNLPTDKRPDRYRYMTRAFGGARPLVLTGRLHASLTERWYQIEPRRTR